MDIVALLEKLAVTPHFQGVLIDQLISEQHSSVRGVFSENNAELLKSLISKKTFYANEDKIVRIFVE